MATSSKPSAAKTRKIMRDVEKLNELAAQVKKMEADQKFIYHHFGTYREADFKLYLEGQKLQKYVNEYLGFFTGIVINFSLKDAIAKFNSYTGNNLELI